MNYFLASLVVLSIASAAAGCGNQNADQPHDDHAHTTDATDSHGHTEETRISPEMAAANGIGTDVVGPGAIRETLALTGRVEPNAERMRQVRARYPGTVKRVLVEAGDKVVAGQTLATIESDDSLQTYALTAPIGGTIAMRTVNPGEASGTNTLFEIIDSRTLWANLAAFPSDRVKLQVGQQVHLIAADGTATSRGKIALITNAVTSHTSTVRVIIDNADSRWTPGQFLNAEVTLNERPASLTVPLAAVQIMDRHEVVFLNKGDLYQAQEVQTGRRDSERVEILSGLAAGAQIVTKNSFLIKADIEKTGAAHEH